MWLNFRLHMHADSRSAWLGGLLQAASGRGQIGVASCLRAHG